MLIDIHFAAVAAGLTVGIAALLWVMACGFAAAKMEKEGFTFWRGFLACMVLSPLAGWIAILVTRMAGPSRRLAETASRS